MERANPEPGDGATLLLQGSELPATVVRVAFDGLVIWLQVDRLEQGQGGEMRFVPDPTAWTFRAARRDGSYRLDPEMDPVEVGMRRFRWHSAIPAAGYETFRARFDRLEPYLLRRRWYPMTSMGIPSLLRSADALLAEMDRYRGPDAERVALLRNRLAVRRDGFRRE